MSNKPLRARGIIIWNNMDSVNLYMWLTSMLKGRTAFALQCLRQHCSAVLASKRLPNACNCQPKICSTYSICNTCTLFSAVMSNTCVDVQGQVSYTGSIWSVLYRCICAC